MLVRAKPRDGAIELPTRSTILVVALRRLGDVLLTTPLIRSLRRAWPDAAIHALVFAPTAGILEGNPDLDAIILRGSNRDVAEVLRIIEDIERISAETVPEVEVVPLKHVPSTALAPLLQSIQRDLLMGRPGRVTIASLGKPNAVLLVGWGEAIKTTRELIAKLDQTVPPQTQLRVFRLRHAAAAADEAHARVAGEGRRVSGGPSAR